MENAENTGVSEPCEYLCLFGFGEFTVAQGEAVSTIRITDFPEPIVPLAPKVIESRDFSTSQSVVLK
jgi:hypothetical protein